MDEKGITVIARVERNLNRHVTGIWLASEFPDNEPIERKPECVDCALVSVHNNTPLQESFTYCSDTLTFDTQSRFPVGSVVGCSRTQRGRFLPFLVLAVHACILPPLLGGP